MSLKEKSTAGPQLAPPTSEKDGFEFQKFQELEAMRETLGTPEHEDLEGIIDPHERFAVYRETSEFKELIQPVYKRAQAMYGKDAPRPAPKVLVELTPERQELVSEIAEFLQTHACREQGEGYEPDTVAYVIEDATALHEAMDSIKAGRTPKGFESSWDSGAYHPFSSEAGRAWHNDLMQQIADLG